jgi:hypothetical protein
MLHNDTKTQLFKLFGILPLLLGSSSFAMMQRSICNTHQADFEPNNILDTFYPKLRVENQMWLSADVLFWIPHEDGVVLTNRKTDLFTVNNITLQPALHTKFDWDFGARVGFGYLISREEAWDTSLHWTYYSARASKRSDTRNDIAEGSFTIWSLSSDIIPYDWIANAKLHWELNLNLLDFDFGRAYSFQWFHIRPYTGLKSAWISQDLSVRYGGGIFANGPDLYAMSNNAGYDQIHMANNYWGLGPMLGIIEQFDLGKGWRIYGNACGSLTGGYFHLVQDEMYLMNTRFHKDTSPGAGRWIIDTVAGVSWSTFLSSERYALSFDLGWEYHIFFHQFALQRDRFGLVPENRNLSVMGGVFSGHLDF